MRIPIASLALLSLAAAPSLSQEPLVTDRPDFTESAAVVAPGRVQVEGGYTVARVEDETEHATGEALVRIGIVYRLEARIEVPTFASLADESGFQEPGLGAKVLLAEAQGARPAIAVLIGASAPTVEDDVGEDAWQPGLTGAAAWDLSDRWSLGVNAGYVYANDGDERFDQATSSVAAGLALTPRAGAFFEIFGIAPVEPGGGGDVTVDGGVTYLLSPDLQLDARIGAGLTDDAPDVQFGVGVSARW